MTYESGGSTSDKAQRVADWLAARPDVVDQIEAAIEDMANAPDASELFDERGALKGAPEGYYPDGFFDEQ